MATATAMVTVLAVGKDVVIQEAAVSPGAKLPPGWQEGLSAWYAAGWDVKDVGPSGHSQRGFGLLLEKR